MNCVRIFPVHDRSMPFGHLQEQPNRVLFTGVIALQQPHISSMYMMALSININSQQAQQVSQAEHGLHPIESNHMVFIIMLKI